MNLPLYFYLLTRFRNGWSLIQNLRHGGWLADGPPCAEIVMRNGCRLTHPPHMGGFAGSLIELWFEQCYTRNGFYEPKDGDVIIDCGAHVGLFSIFIARRNPNCRVISFEPSENYDYLQRNVVAVGMKNIEIHRLAVGKEHGWVHMVHSTGRSIDNRAESVAKADSTAVKLIPLTEVLAMAKQERIAFFKMDIEGSELDVMNAATRETLLRIERFGIEYHDNLVPGALKRLREILAPTHELRVEPTPHGHGLLTAWLKK